MPPLSEVLWAAFIDNVVLRVPQRERVMAVQLQCRWRVICGTTFVIFFIIYSLNEFCRFAQYCFLMNANGRSQHPERSRGHSP